MRFTYALVVCVTLALPGEMLSQQGSAGPSLEETVAYINAHTSHSSELKSDGRIDVAVRISVSPQTNSLLVETHFGDGRAEYANVPFNVASNLKIVRIDDADGSGRVRLTCPGFGSSSYCMHIRKVDPHTHNKEFRDRQEETGVEDISFFEDPGQGERLVHAATRLMTVMNQLYEQQNRQRDTNDPFK